MGLAGRQGWIRQSQFKPNLLRVSICGQGLSQIRGPEFAKLDL